jgi:tRNA threonylcarbamoyladenosine biosynthesis protein TsaE
MNPYSFVAENLADTDRLGQALAEVLPDGTVVALCGTLGAGKTRLVKAIAAGCGIPSEEVVSPTFILCQEYRGRRTLFHLDAYRLRSTEEFRQLGVDELFRSPALVLIEWADRVEGALPAERVEIRIEVGADERRRFEIIGRGERLADVTRKLGERIKSGD